MKKYIIISTYLCILLSILSCSTTSSLDEGEYLYVGLEPIEIRGEQTSGYEDATSDVKAALEYAPNSSFMGSSYIRQPLPVGLWVYNAYAKNHDHGLRKWIFNTFSTQPKTIASVSPDTRAKVAANALQNYGYFNASVDYRLVDQKDPKKKKIAYTIDLGQPYLLDSLKYSMNPTEDSIRIANLSASLIHQDDQVNLSNLQLEKDRLTELMHENGFYYFRSDYFNYYADSTMSPGRMKLLLMEDPDMPLQAKTQWHIGNVEFRIQGEQGAGSREQVAGSREWGLDSMDSVMVRGVKFKYTGGKCPVSPEILRRNLRLRQGSLFRQSRIDQTLTHISNMQTFSSIRFNYTPRDDSLDLRIDCQMDKLIDAELDLNVTQKSNAQIGPSAALTVAKRNAFGSGETFSVKAKGSYEWQLPNSGGERIDSYEAGIDASVKFPWLAFPGLSSKRFRYASSSTVKAGFDHLKRAGYYRLLQLHASIDYTFKTNRYYTHTLTPLSLTYNKLEESTARFDSIVGHNKALYYSLSDQLIPAIAYNIVYDNSWKNLDFYTRVELSVKESGNVVSGVMGLCGRDISEEGKKLLNVPYSQFLKTSLDIRHTILLTPSSQLATRFFTGAVFAFGNCSVAPYSELFYAGGANDIRAFGAHTIGPGSYYDTEGRNTYLDQAGSFKLLLNAEYRFKMVGDLHGAFFLDAGNVWNLRSMDSHPGGWLRDGGFLKSIATGTGFGLRYDLSFLVLRLDMGVALHAPYDTGKAGYYNINKFFKDGVAFHFAVGYPF